MQLAAQQFKIAVVSKLGQHCLVVDRPTAIKVLDFFHQLVQFAFGAILGKELAKLALFDSSFLQLGFFAAFEDLLELNGSAGELLA